LFSEDIEKWLNTALDLGITEGDFWYMTFAELTRAFESKARVTKIEEQKRATYDYILADLIGRSISRVYGSANKMPSISEAYPSLFNEAEEQEKIQKKKDELSALRFKMFADSFNNRH
jgi:hypothetical protein